MAAMANAIHNAIGKRLTDLPMSPPKVLAALSAK
jgi:CO/xanthine dehydrogenase Mo-binding subunit